MISGVVVAAVYAVIALTTFGIGERQLYDGGSAPDYAPIELSYNYITYTSGAVEYSVQASFDTERLNPDSDVDTAAAIADTVQKIRSAFEARGYAIGSGSNSEFVTATILYASDLTELDIMLGNDGYATSSSSAVVEREFWRQDYVIPLSYPFDGDEDSVLTEITALAMQIPGVTIEDVDTVYNFGSYYSTKTLESNADYVYILNNGSDKSYIHEFRVNLSDEPGEYYLVQHSPNSVSAYIVLIVLALVAGGAVMLISGSRKRA